MNYTEWETDKYILNEFFKEYTGIMVEVGAGPPITYSMSKIFRENNWRTICVEPNLYYVDLHKKEGNEIYHYALSNQIIDNHDFEIIKLDGYYNGTEFNNGIAYSAINMRYNTNEHYDKEIIKVNITTLNWLLNSLHIKVVDFVSIDVEGWELEVMQGFNTNLYKPKIILLENFNQDESYNLYMSSLGYVLNNKISHNYIYINEKS